MKEMDISAMEKVRSPIVSGLFYPDEKASAAAAFCSYGLEQGIGGKAGAIIAPHGAWNLSGSIAAAAFAAAAGRIRKQNKDGISKVVLLGPTHNYPEEGLFLSDSRFFGTPLGMLPVDRPLCAALASCSTLMEFNDIPHLKETSLEVLLPFIKFCFPETAIVPVLMSGSQPRLISALARALALVFRPILEETLFVVSSNLSLNKDEKTSLAQAETCLRLLREKKNSEFITGIHRGGISACGGSPIAALLESGIPDNWTAVTISDSLVQAQAERGQITFYGAIAFG
jgi:AmmeMemoRadiSam system protein B